MQLRYDPHASLEFQFSVEPHTPERKAAIDAIRNWSDDEQLAKFASERHGYMNSNSHFGITYPTDLDDVDRANGGNIPAGYVQAIAGYGDPHAETHLIPELEYVELLRQYLVIKNMPAMADEITELKTLLTQKFGE